MEPIQWSEKFSVGVEELDQQHQQLIKMLNRLLLPRDTVDTRSETISEILLMMTRYAQGHFKMEESLLDAYDYPDLQEQKQEHRDFRKKTVALSMDTTSGVDTVPEALITFLFEWWSHHILDEDMKYKPFFAEKGVK